jgi:hypothetical protein
MRVKHTQSTKEYTFFRKSFMGHDKVGGRLSMTTCKLATHHKVKYKRNSNVLIEGRKKVFNV